MEVFDGVAGVAIGDTLLTLWKAPARCARIRQVAAWTDSLVRASPGGIAACQFLLPGAKPPDRKARAEARKGFDAVEASCRRLITVPLGSALWQSLVRAIIRVAVRVSGKSWLVKIAATEQEAFDLLLEVATPHSPQQEQLRAALDALYAALDVHPPHGARS